MTCLKSWRLASPADLTSSLHPWMDSSPMLPDSVEEFCQEHPSRDFSSIKETLGETLAALLETSKAPSGRSILSSKRTIPNLLVLAKTLGETYTTSPSQHLVPALQVLRNLCAGDSANICTFLLSSGVESLRSIFRSVNFNPQIVQIGLQVLANIVLAGSRYHLEVWSQFYPLGLEDVSQICCREVADIICRILYEMCREDDGRLEELQGVDGVRIIAEIVKTTSLVGFQGDHLLWLLSKTCYGGTFFSRIFMLVPADSSARGGSLKLGDIQFTGGQVFLLDLLSKIHEQFVSDDFVLTIFQILKNASSVVHSILKCDMDPKTNSPAFEVLEYSLLILRDVCACGVDNDKKMDCSSAVNSLLSSGVLKFLLDSLAELEPPEIIRRSSAQDLHLGKIPCPYEGYRGDLVVVIANCAFRRKEVQDEIRRENGILLLLQQCVIDEGNPLLREKGLWAIRNLLEGNEDNQREVDGLEIQGSVDLPATSDLGLKVKVDPVTRRAKLVNTLAPASKQP